MFKSRNVSLDFKK